MSTEQKRNPLDTTEVRHFVSCARRGAGRGASSGEKCCHEIAKVLLENASCIDSKAVDGLTQFAILANMNPHVLRKAVGM